MLVNGGMQSCISGLQISKSYVTSALTDYSRAAAMAMAPNATYAACASMLLAAPVYATGPADDVDVAEPFVVPFGPTTVAYAEIGNGLAEPYVYAPPEPGTLHVGAGVDDVKMMADELGT